jgi:hypothetical protein
VIEEHQPDQVAVWRGHGAEVGQQCGRFSVPGQHVHAPVDDHRGDVVHVVE